MKRTSAGIAGSARDTAGAWRRLLWNHPELPLAVAAVAAWPAMDVATFAAMVGHRGMGPMAGMGHNGVIGPAMPENHAMSALPWVLMVVAMMLPTILPAARWVSLSVRWSRRLRAPALFALGYLAVWITAGVAALAALRPLHIASGGRWVIVAALTIAVGWELAPWKLRFLRACHRLRPIPPSGWRAEWGCVQRGITTGGSCLGAGWAMMSPMLLAGPMVGMWLMVPITVVMLWQRFAVKAAKVVRPAAAALAALAVVVAIW
jgi:predicted metal-binding membrane protein